MVHSNSLELELPISRDVERRYRLGDEFLLPDGRLRSAEMAFLRRLALRLNEARDVARHPERGLSAGQLNGLGLLRGFSRWLLGRYREERNPRVYSLALAWLSARWGPERLERLLARFAALFPIAGFEPESLDVEAFLAGMHRGLSNRERVLEGIFLLFFAAENPALAPLRDLFDDSQLEADTGYREMIASLADFFADQPGWGPEERSLFELLRDPVAAAPESLREQLTWIFGRWGAAGLASDSWLVGLGVLKEEEKPPAGPPGPRPPEVHTPDFGMLEIEEERFSRDRGWMPELVLIARNAYVWLDQLSRRHGLEIRRLDQIPDTELDRLASWGITGLWLIGIWERSPASKKIKELCGNPEAAASAYSIYDMGIAERLGGEAALEKLRERAARRGMRLACDMVPNHTGIDSRWVIERPERFLSVPESPFPNYTFTGPDLSSDPRVGIFIEDHYYDRSDAAVVFKRLDRRSGEARYVYHGNDGTSFPWNDTAQIDYLNPEAREAVIQTILAVARRFSVIRFDAAMTLAKRHVQRLWFPEPGSGGDIASRAERGLTKAEFDRLMPEEFWREVVDRVAEEVPDTLLLAEAFWMMEGYFVRTLGMHRVYNSAFMHMLRDEDNTQYRQTIKETLEFDPGILQRYVNFLTNPDEETAIEQFGKGDKYFGVCLLMATLPGLPMFGHGQFEGFWEKYGMEYQRAYHDERPDVDLMARHEREIVPLLRRRALFAEVENFRLYDFAAAEGHVAQDVFAYSNRRGGERALVIYHNRYASVAGWINHSVPFLDKARGELRRESLADFLGLAVDGDLFVAYRDLLSGLEYLRPSAEIAFRGLFLSLGAYERRVFLDFRTVRDNAAAQVRQLAARLNGHGVPSLEVALRELAVQPVQAPIGELLSVETLRRFGQLDAADGEACEAFLDEFEARAGRIFEEIAPLVEGSAAPKAATLPVDGEGKWLSTVEQMGLESSAKPAATAENLAAGVRRTLEAILEFDFPEEIEEVGEEEEASPEPETEIEIEAGEGAGELSENQRAAFAAWAILRELGQLRGGEESAASSRDLIDEWMLADPLRGALAALGDDSERAVRAILLFTERPLWHRELGTAEAGEELEAWLADDGVRRLLGVNSFGGAVWFNREGFAVFLLWLRVTAAVDLLAEWETLEAGEAAELWDRVIQLVAELEAAEAESEHHLEKLLAALS